MHYLEQSEQRNQLVESLRNHTTYNEMEDQHLLFMLDFIDGHANYCSRENLKGHFTTSAWITNEAEDKVLLIHHRKLDRWLQPGGHIETEDQDFSLAALREALEETGLKSFRFKNGSRAFYDVDVHVIPARKSDPEHYHLDLRFHLYADENEAPEINDEVKGLKWFTKDEIRSQETDESVLRMLDRM